MQKNSAFAIVYAVLMVMTVPTCAADQEATAGITVPAGATLIEAHQLEMLLDRKLRAIGEAEIRQDDKILRGDRIHYDLISEELHVIGNVALEQDGKLVTGTELRIRLKEREGEMKEPVFIYRKALPAGAREAFLPPIPHVRGTDVDAADQQPWPTGSSRSDASLLIFEGPQRERIHRARYTTCAVGVDDWYLYASELELNHHSNTGTAKHARIEFKGVPILYTPWINFPLEKQRKSGFLAPSFGTTTRSGVEFVLPYYWNIAPDKDATITPRLLGKRGMQLMGEYRYLSENYSGEDSIEFLPNDNQAGRDRWLARIQHHHQFGNGWSGWINLERVSDDQYFSDLSTNIAVTSRVNLPQEGYLNYQGEVWNFSAMAQQFQTLDDLSYPYERLPQLILTGHKEWDFAIGNLYAQWSRFDHADGAPVTTAIVPGATLTTAVTGERLVAYPNISLPVERSYGYITPKLGLHYTRYSLNDPEYWLNANPSIDPASKYQSDTRLLPIFSVDGGVYFDRDFRVVKNMYTQTLEPRFFYVYIPYRDQSQLPVFDTTEADLNLTTLFSENQFSGNDRINDANQLTLALTTQLIEQRTGIQRLTATVGQRFYFNDRRVILPGGEARTDSASEIVSALTARLRSHWNANIVWLYDTDEDRTAKANIGASYYPEPGKVLNLDYRYTRERLEHIDISTEWPLGRNWYGLARWNYSLAESRPIEGLLGAEYNAGCWQARTVLHRVETATAKTNYAFFFQLELGGMASIGTSPLSLLRRSIPGYQSSALLPHIMPR